MEPASPTIDLDEGERAAGGDAGPAEPSEADPTAGAGGAEGTAPPPDRLVARLTWVALTAALIPLVVAAARAVHQGWIPVGDSALIAIRSRDVLGGEMPRLGMWASSSWSVGFDMNHPGPLLYLVLAVPARLWGGGAGLVAGTLLVNVASVAATFAVARRRGPLVALAAMAVAAVLCWSMGSAVLVEPWHATTVLLPFLLFTLLVWSVLAGDVACLPWAVLVGSLVLQTNLSYAVLVPVLLLAAGVRVGVDRWRHGRRPARWVVAAAAVGVLAWALPLAEQFTGPGEGNLSRLWRSRSADVMTLDVRKGVRSLASVVALPPWILRPSYGHDFTFSAFGNPLPGLPLALLGLAVLGGVLAVLGWQARRRGDGDGAVLAATAGGLVVLAGVTAVETPTGNFGTVAYQVRWLWPVGAFVLLAVVVSAVRWVARTPRAARVAAVALTGVTVAVAVANVPASDQGTTAPASTEPIAESVVRAVRDADLAGPFHVECAEHVFDPYCEPVMAELQREGVPMVIDGDLGLRQLGVERRWDGDPTTPTLTVVTGDFAIFTPPGARPVTRHRGLDRRTQTELYLLEQGLEGAVGAGAVRLNERGRRVAERGDLVSVARGSTDIDPSRVAEVRSQLFGTYRRDLVAMAREDLVEADGPWAERLDRYADLQERWDAHTVAVFVTP